MSSPPVDAVDILCTAGTNTLQLADNEMTQEITDHIPMVGKKMVALIPNGEQVSFFIPVFVRVGGKTRPGGLLYTEKHVIVGYTEGAMRLSTSYARVIPLAAITSSPISRQKSDRSLRNPLR